MHDERNDCQEAQATETEIPLRPAETSTDVREWNNYERIIIEPDDDGIMDSMGS